VISIARAGLEKENEDESRRIEPPPPRSEERRRRRGVSATTGITTVT
jgi:hypothetical protein